MRSAGPAAQPSIRRRLLGFLVISMMATLVLAATVGYAVALRYSNSIHDRDLIADVRSVATMLQQGRSRGLLSDQAKFLLEYDIPGRNFFEIRSRRHGLVGSSVQPISPGSSFATGQSAGTYDARVGSLPVRASSLSLPSPGEPTDVLTITVAETLDDRHRAARDILLLIVPFQLFLIAFLMAFVWQGVNFGLRVLDPLRERLAARGHELAPITDADVPTEILPLTRTIDALFSRLRDLIELHERFIADAAHQLRTPLAGLSLHAERAMRASQPEDRDRSLVYIQELVTRVARTSSQLLALSVADRPRTEAEVLVPVDLSQLVPETLGFHIPQALRDGVDLGYEGPNDPLLIFGDPNSLRELIDNLVDNAIRYAARGATVTIGLRSIHGKETTISIDDDGPGVPAPLLTRLGERFFRAPGTAPGGTGLGLAIVQRVAHRHGANVVFSTSALGGLRVEVKFPAMDVH